MKVLVCGSRKWSDRDAIYRRLDELDIENLSVAVITGTRFSVARASFEYRDVPDEKQVGADRIAAAWARESGRDYTVIEPDWATHGKAAGPIRNRQMLDLQPDLVVAFRLPGTSNGTDDTVREARRRGIPVEVYAPGEASA